MPSGSTLRAFDSRGTFERVDVADAASQTIEVTSTKVNAVPASGTDAGIHTITTGVTGSLRIQNGTASTTSLAIEDGSGNIDCGGSDVALAAGEAVVLESRIESDGTKRWALVAVIKK